MVDFYSYQTLKRIALALTLCTAGLLGAGTGTAYLLVCVDGAVDVPCAKTTIFEFGDTMFGQEASGTYGFVAFATIGALLGSLLLLAAATRPPSVLGLLLAFATWTLSGLAAFVYAGSKAFKARGLRASNSTISVGPGWYFELFGWIVASAVLVLNRQLQTRQYAKDKAADAQQQRSGGTRM